MRQGFWRLWRVFSVCFPSNWLPISFFRDRKSKIEQRIQKSLTLTARSHFPGLFETRPPPLGTGDGKVWISRFCFFNDMCLSFCSFHAPEACFPYPSKNMPKCSMGLRRNPTVCFAGYGYVLQVWDPYRACSIAHQNGSRTDSINTSARKWFF